MLFAPVQHEQLELLDFNLTDVAHSEVSDINGNKFILSDSLKADKTIMIYIARIASISSWGISEFLTRKPLAILADK